MKSFFCQGGVAGYATKFIHSQTESGLGKYSFPKVLEVGGGGEGFHVPHVKHDFARYYLTDFSTRNLAKDALSLKAENRLTLVSTDAELLSFKNSRFDRVIFMCVLHHLNDRYKALQEFLRVVRDKGLITIYLPCDPGFAYRQFRKIALRSKLNQLNLNYSLINAKEHHKHVYGLEIFIKEVFKELKIIQKSFPFRIKLHDLNIFNIYQIWVTK
jgi:phosphatidylethanolamine/phosphatidyl-N-methylethanolamine N-methyltransferase